MDRARVELDGMDEAELLAAARDGSRAAQEELTRRSQPAFRAFLAGKLGARVARTMTAADVEQEAYLQVLQALPGLDALDSMRAFTALLQRRALWLIYRASDARERFAGESAFSRPIAEGVLDATGATRPGEVTRADEVRWLTDQVDRLAPRPAEVMRLRLLGAEFPEIAAELGIGEEAARKRYLRALSELRRRMDPDAD